MNIKDFKPKPTTKFKISVDPRNVVKIIKWVREQIIKTKINIERRNEE